MITIPYKRHNTGIIAILLVTLVATIASCQGPKQRGQKSEKAATEEQEKKSPSVTDQQTVNPNDKKALGPIATPFDKPDVFADVAERAVKSVVNISSVKVIRTQGGAVTSPFFNDPFFRHFFGPQMHRRMPKERREKSLGSGVIVSKDGIVLTNNHVVEKAEKITVGLAEGEQEYEAEIVGSDPKSDVAVLKLKGDLKDIQPLPFGDSSKLRLGEMVLAVGNPFGLSHTVTFGIVSAKGRADVGIVDYEDFIQTDAAINPGNSGGALVNLRGELVGINTAILSRSGGYQGIGFAIPANMAKPVMDSLIKHGRVVRGWLGVSIQDVTKELADALGLPNSRGVLIADVVADGPADKAGFKRGDVVLSINGEKMDSSAKLRNLIAVLGTGSKARIEFKRDKVVKTIEVTLGELPADLGGIAKVAPDEGALGGLTIGALNPANRDKYEIPERLQTGVVITAVEPGSPAHSAGLKPGDVLIELNKMPIQSVPAFTELYRKSKSNILLLIYRDGSTMYLVFRR
ncbi:MAG: DegQ family serine endoprotease [Myxococcota bacterium]|nr:DegQ family serine endoprotease [Myxococcota bacterium]